MSIENDLADAKAENEQLRAEIERLNLAYMFATNRAQFYEAKTMTEHWCDAGEPWVGCSIRRQLETDNKRLRAALQEAEPHLYMATDRIRWMVHAALEPKP
jgi:hypothetical protein